VSRPENDVAARAALEGFPGGYVLMRAIRRKGEIVDWELRDANGFTDGGELPLAGLRGQRLSRNQALSESSFRELNCDALRTGRRVQADVFIPTPTPALRNVTVVPLGEDMTATFIEDLTPQDRFRMLVASSSDLVAIVDDKAELVYINDAGRRTLGFLADENVGLDMLEFVHPDDREETAATFFQLVSEPTLHPTVVARFRTASEEWRFLEVRAINCLDDPAVGGIVCNARDVTERVLAERHGRESAVLLDAIVESTQDWIWSVDIETYGLVSYNRSMREYFAKHGGIVLELGMRPEDLGPDPSRVGKWYEYFGQAKETGSFSTEYEAEAGAAVLQLTMNVLERDGKPFAIALVGKDITERKQAEQKISETLSLLDTLQSSAPVGFAFLDRDFRFARVNEKAAAINGLSVEDHIGRTLADINPRAWSQIEPFYRKVMSEGDPLVNLEVTSGSAKDPGEVHTWLESYYPVRVAGETIGIGEVFVDITERKEAERAQQALAASLEASEARFRVLADTAPIGIFELSPGGGLTYANSKIGKITGRDAWSLGGRGWIDAVHPEDREILTSLFENFRPKAAVTTALRIQHPSGELRHVRLQAAPKGEDPESGYVVTIEDVTEEVEAHGELVHQAFYDTLTGLPNRALFLDRLNQELARRRRSGSSIAVFFLDLDRFKDVNDSLGHEAGDAVLKEVGVRFIGAVRAGETVARFGGDEFAFIIRDVGDSHSAVTVADRVLSVLEMPIRYDAHELVVTGSIGIVIPAARSNAETVLRDADAAMYKAKAAGRNRSEFFDEETRRRLVARFEMETELRQALAHGEFEVYYQPEVAGDGQPLGAEALIRWNHPTRGLVPPLDFIPLAEDLGLIKPIGAWVFEAAVAQLSSWDAQEDGPRLGVLSINISSNQLEDPDTSEVIRAIIERYGIAPSRLALEVTESVLMADSPSTRTSLQRFKDMGLGVAIDDFGTGYSSLAYLHTLPVTTLKIDRSFIERLEDPVDSAQIVKAIVDLGHAMGLRVIAEGVSNERLHELVSTLGCDLAQGFFWARPLPVRQFEHWWGEAERGLAPPPHES
jgi:diguanylate cyclase (GGDEF)-like protein/PAS domain S-box-containing protein